MEDTNALLASWGKVDQESARSARSGSSERTQRTRPNGQVELHAAELRGMA